jgi:hypothetical protein
MAGRVGGVASEYSCGVNKFDLNICKWGLRYQMYMSNIHQKKNFTVTLATFLIEVEQVSDENGWSKEDKNDVRND